MGIIVSLVWMFIQSNWMKWWELLLKVPRWVWITLGVCIAFLWYGNYVEKKTRAEVHAYYKALGEKEAERQRMVYKTQLELAAGRWIDAQSELSRMEGELSDAIKEAAESKTRDEEAIPANLGDRLSGLRDKQRKLIQAPRRTPRTRP